jgi:hypothetical protein
VLSRLFKPRPAPYLAMAEFWVYLPEPAAPSQDDVMTRMIQASPYAKKGRAPIGPKEGLLWSDVRFHMALALREKNAHIFRPDLFESHVSPTAEMLGALSGSKALVKLRYVSEQRLPDNRHLQFLTYAAEAVAHLSGSEAIFDLIGERLFTPAWLAEKLAEDSDGSRKELQLQTIWRCSPAGGTAETRGLQKIGLQELSTPETMPDHRIVAMQVLESAADQIWDAGKIEPQMTIEHYGDSFHVLIDQARKGPLRTRILREQH